MDEKQMLMRMCEDIAQITGIKTTVYDADFRGLCAVPDSMCAFCQQVRRSAERQERCLASDREGFMRCRESRQIEIYRCHMGLTEVVVPVITDGTVLGYLLFGQLLTEGTQADIRERIAQQPTDDRAALTAALREIPITPLPIVESSARLMGMCAGYARLSGILRGRSDRLSLQIERYIGEHLSDPELNIRTIGRHFGVSRGTLYNISKQAFGEGLSSYIRKRRLQAALELLPQGLSMTETARRAGFADADSMSKLIKKECGMAPKKLQKLRVSEK